MGPLRVLLALVLAFSTLTLSACGAEQRQSELGCATGAVPCLSGSAVVALETSKGEVQVQLDGKAAPLTAGNFVDLVGRGAYDNTVFHRVVREPVPFVVQGGDPQSADPKVNPSQYGLGSFIDPALGSPRLIPLEIALEGEGEPRYGQEVAGPGQNGKLKLVHERGSLAMARSQDPNSASAQFYIALRGLPELDGRYAVFGRVIKGMDVVDKIQQGDKINKARLLEGGTLIKGKP